MEEIGVRLVAENGAQFVTIVNNAQTAVTNFAKGAEENAPRVGKASEVMIGALRKVGEIATNAALEAGKAVVSFVGDSVKVAADFESGMGRFSAVAGDLSKSGLSVEDFKNKFLQLGKDTQFSATQAQDAMIELVKGGVDVKDSYGGATQATLDLAAATKMELAQAAEIVAKQLGVWGDKGLDATTAVNLLNQAADASTVNVDDLALGLSNSSGTAKVAGVSYKDLVTTMALIAPSFNSAASAGDSYKNFLLRLSPATDEQTAAMVDLGLATKDGKSAFYDAQGQFVGMEKTAQMLQNATKDLTEEQRKNYFRVIFGNDAMNAAAAIAEKGAAGFNEMSGAMDDQGTASEKAAKLNQGFNFAMEQLSGSLETLQIIIGSAVLPILTKLINEVVVPAVNKVMDFAQSFTTGGASIDDFVVRFGSLFGLGSETWETFDYIRSTVMNVVKEIYKVASVYIKLLTEFWEENGEEIKAFIEETWDAILNIIAEVMAIINATVIPALKGLAKFISEHGTEIKQLFTNVWTFIKTLIDTALTLILGIVKLALAILNGDTTKALDVLKETFGKVWENIKTLVTTAINQIVLVIKLALDALKQAVGEKMEAVKNSIVNAINNALEGVRAKFEEFRSAGSEFISRMVVGIGAVAFTVYNAVNSAVTGALKVVSDLGASIVQLGTDIVTSIVTGITNSAKAIYNAVWNAVKAAIDAAIKAIKDFIANPLGGLTGGGQFSSSSRQNRVSMAATSGQISNSYSRTSSTNFNLTVNSGQSVGGLMGDFAVMEAMAG